MSFQRFISDASESFVNFLLKAVAVDVDSIVDAWNEIQWKHTLIDVTPKLLSCRLIDAAKLNLIKMDLAVDSSPERRELQPLLLSAVYRLPFDKYLKEEHIFNQLKT